MCKSRPLGWFGSLSLTSVSVFFENCLGEYDLGQDLSEFFSSLQNIQQFLNFITVYHYFGVALDPGCCESFLQLQPAVTTLCCSVWAFPCAGFSLQSTGCKHTGFSSCSVRARGCAGFSSCSACGILVTGLRISETCVLLHWQAASQALHHQGSPAVFYCYFIFHFMKCAVKF